MLIAGSCSKILEGHPDPQSNIVPYIFYTPGGLSCWPVYAGVYNDLRSLWGTEGFSMQNLGGVDETLEGASATSPDYFTYNPMTSADETQGWWNNAYHDINTCNAVLQFGQTVVGLDSVTRRQYLAQAKFLRAFWYFYLVQNFGDVPLHLTYITQPKPLRIHVAPIAGRIPTQIIQDLTDASTRAAGHFTNSSDGCLAIWRKSRRPGRRPVSAGKSVPHTGYRILAMCPCILPILPSPARRIRANPWQQYIHRSSRTSRMHLHNCKVTSPMTASASQPFRKAAAGRALYLLGKVYLTRGWSSAAVAGDFARSGQRAYQPDH